MLRKALATVVIGCMMGLSFGAFSGDSQASGLETVMDQRPVDTARQIVPDKPCPTIQEIAASRNRLAAGTTTAEYIAARDAARWLVRCRGQFDWVLSLMKQTPEGRAYLARIVAHVNERLRLECGCAEGYSFVVLDQGGGPSYGAQWAAEGGAIQVTAISAGAAVVLGTAIVNYLEAQGSLTPEQARAARATIGMAGAFAGVFNARVNQSLQFYADMQRFMWREHYYDMQMRGADGGGPAISDIWRGRDPER